MVSHLVPLRRVAERAGVSEATVDRVVNGRPGVRTDTALRVERAMNELVQELAGAVSVTPAVVDIVVQLPTSLAELVDDAVDRQSLLLPGPVEIKKHLLPVDGRVQLEAVLTDVARSDSLGLLLAAGDRADLAQRLTALTTQGKPTVTLLGDVAPTARMAYAGSSPYAAGATAAHLLSTLTQPRGGRRYGVVVMPKRELGLHRDRRRGFVETWRALHLDQVVVAARASSFMELEASLNGLPDGLDGGLGVFVVGDPTEEVLRYLADLGLPTRAVAACDLTRENRRLLMLSRLAAVLYDDLSAQINYGVRVLLSQHGLAPTPTLNTARTLIGTPFNLPAD